jgi:gentisate 1,2-dioxygenase
MAIETPRGVDTDQDYYRRLDELNVAAYWKMKLAAQVHAAVPYVWHWKELYPALAASVDVVELQRGGAERRVITMANPGRQPGTGATHTLQASLQMILPGEVAPAHRHSFAAFRFIISGQGAYTVVDGEKCAMAAGDLILTPNWTWHDHGNEGSEPMVWLDGLDVPLVGALRAMFYEDFAGRVAQPVTADCPSPDKIYPWAEALERLRASDAGEAVEYLNPLRAGHVMPTLSCYLQALPPGFHTKRQRHSPSDVYFVVRGSGRSIVGDQELAWEQNDILAVPNWTWYEHIGGDEEAILFSFSDRPALEALQLFREELQLTA